MKGLGGETKRLQHNIVDLFPDLPTVPDRQSDGSESVSYPLIEEEKALISPL